MQTQSFPKSSTRLEQFQKISRTKKIANLCKKSSKWLKAS